MTSVWREIFPYRRPALGSIDLDQRAGYTPPLSLQLVALAIDIVANGKSDSDAPGIWHQLDVAILSSNDGEIRPGRIVFTRRDTSEGTAQHFNAEEHGVISELLQTHMPKYIKPGRTQSSVECKWTFTYTDSYTDSDGSLDWLYIDFDFLHPSSSNNYLLVDWEAHSITEWWGDWDLTKSTVFLTEAQLRDPPVRSSIRSNPELETVMGWYFRCTHTSNREDDKWAYRHGPTPEERLAMWQNDDDARLRLVRHLQTLPHVLMDMEQEPMKPWKGMLFFHGSTYAHLQSAEDAATNDTSRNYNKCQLTWGPHPVPGNAPLTAFTTPYFSKAFNYSEGKRIYTYRLTVDGSQLRLLDLRNDYHESRRDDDALDPFRPIWELAGIPHGERNRVFKARMLQKLFRGSGVDGAILNMDIEWIWFNPSSVLDWVNPENKLQELLLKDYTSEIEKYTQTDKVRRAGGAKIALIRKLLQPRFDEAAVAAFLASTLVRKSVKPLVDMDHVRWALDLVPDGYVSQFATPSGTHTKMWQRRKVKTGSSVNVTVYECDYLDLCRFFCPGGEMDNMYMANAVTEGNADMRSLAPYALLVNALNSRELAEHVRQDDIIGSRYDARRMEMRFNSTASPADIEAENKLNAEEKAELKKPKDFIRLMVHLPSGHIQIVPTLTSAETDNLQPRVPKRKAGHDHDSHSSNTSQRVSGRLGRLVIC